MTQAPLHNDNVRYTLAGRSITHALDVLANATGATATLFDDDGNVLVGPAPGTTFVREILSTQKGRTAVAALHRQEAHPTDKDPLPDVGLLRQAFRQHFAIPVSTNGQCVGTLTIGDRPSEPVPPQLTDKIANAMGLDANKLQQAASDLPPWTEADASAARNMAALIAEMFSDLCAQEDDLRRRINELTAVYDINAMLAGASDLKEILDTTTRIVCDVMHVKACSLRLLDEATGVLYVKSIHNLSPEYLGKGPVILSQNPIDQAAMAGKVARIADAPNDPRTQYPEQARKEGIISGMVCGMIYRGKAVGVLRVYTSEPHEFSPFEEALLRAVASQAAAAIVNARLLAETLEAERYARQLAYAGEVQRRMIPSEPPRHEHAEIAAVYQPTFEVGGDFYDFIKLPKGNLGIAIADVSGKGVPASLQMASLRSVLRVNAHFTYDIERIVTEVNRYACRDTSVGEFATVFYGVLSPHAGRLTYCNAGHDPPLLLRGDTIQELSVGGMVVGVDKHTTFKRDLVQLRPGDIILLYTDGAVEALNFNDERFGRPRLADSLRKYADQPADLLVKNILWDLRRFRGLADRTDDLTLVAIKIK